MNYPSNQWGDTRMIRQSARAAAIWLGAFLVAAGSLVAWNSFAFTQVPTQVAGGGGATFTNVEAWRGDKYLEPDAHRLYSQLEPLLRNAAAVAQNDRRNFYSAYNDGVNWKISGWNAGIIDVQAAGDGGYSVTLAVNPEFSASADGATVVSGDYTESWHVNPETGATDYRGFSDPVGLAGGPLNKIR